MQRRLRVWFQQLSLAGPVPEKAKAAAAAAGEKEPGDQAEHQPDQTECDRVAEFV